MVGLGESFFVAYALSQGISDFIASLISTLPLVAGALMQLIAPWGIRKVGSYHGWAVSMATLQALALFAIAVATQFSPSVLLLFSLVAFYWGCGLAVGPAWNSWMSKIVPVRVRTQYFSRRSLWCHLFTFIGLLAGGLILEWGTKHQLLKGTFTFLFSLAGFARLISAYALNQQSQPATDLSEVARGDLTHMFNVFSKSPLRRIMLFMLIFQTATNTSSGLFSPYMLNHLRLSYIEYITLLCAALLARFVTLHFAKSLIKTLSLRGVFLCSLCLIAPVPYLWTLSNSTQWLLLLQAASGVGWGFFELVTFLTMFNDLPAKERPSVLAFFNLLQTSGIVVGSLVGGFVFKSLGHNLAAYEFIFSASSALRITALAALPGLPWNLIHFKNWVELRPISVRAHGGLLSRPILVRIPFPRRTSRAKSAKAKNDLAK